MSEEQKPVWNVATQGPLRPDQEGVYEVVGRPADIPLLDPSGNPVQVPEEKPAKRR